MLVDLSDQQDAHEPQAILRRLSDVGSSIHHAPAERVVDLNVVRLRDPVFGKPECDFTDLSSQLIVGKLVCRSEVTHHKETFELCRGHAQLTCNSRRVSTDFSPFLCEVRVSEF